MIGVTSPFSEEDPTVAFNGSNYLVVWHDRRNQTNTGSDLYGVRVGPDGTVLDPAGIAICIQPGNQEHPAVAANGPDFLVVWEDGRNLGSTGTDVFGTLVSRDGLVSAPEGIPIVTAPKYQGQPRIAANGWQFLVVWDDVRSNIGDIYGTFVTPAGQVVQSNGFVIGSADTYKIFPVVAAKGDEFFVAWQNSFFRDGISAARVTVGGVVVPEATNSLVITTNGQSPAVASDGADVLVVWREGAGFETNLLQAARVTAGVVQPTITLARTPPYDSYPPMTPALIGRTADPARGYLCVWVQNGVRGARISSLGELVDSNAFVVNSQAYAPSLAPGRPGTALVASESFRYNVLRIACNLVDWRPQLTSITRESNAIRIAWTAEPNARYRLQATDRLPSVNWLDVGNPVMAQGLTATQIDLAPADTLKFYRVWQVP